MILSDILGSEEAGLNFDIYYTSGADHDNYQALGSGWRHSYVRQLDPKLTDMEAELQAPRYTDAEQACNLGWEDIKASYYNGMLAQHQATYDSSSGLCVVSDAGGIIKARLGMWNEDNNLLGDIRRLSRPDGTTILLLPDSEETDTWRPINSGTAKLGVNADGWSFQDEADNIEYYNASGWLTAIDQHGAVIEILYNDSGQQSEIRSLVTGQYVTFTYDHNGQMYTITNGDGEKELEIYFTAEDQLSGLEIAGTFQEDYHYNEDGLLSKRIIDSIKAIVNEDYWYDASGRLLDSNIQVSMVNSEVNEQLAVASNQSDAGQAIDADTNSSDALVDDEDILPEQSAASFRYEGNNTIVVSDDAGNEERYTYDVINDKEIVTAKSSSDGVQQNFEYDELGNLIAVSSSATEANASITASTASNASDSFASDWNYRVEMSYNAHNQMVRAALFSAPANQISASAAMVRAVAPDFVAEYAYADSRWNKPTAQLIDDNLQLMTYNSQGQVQSVSEAQLLKSNHQAQSAGGGTPTLANLTATNYEIISSQELSYNNKGQLVELRKDDESFSFNYHDDGDLAATILPNGEIITKQPLEIAGEEQPGNQMAPMGLSSHHVSRLPSIGTPSLGTATLFVGGAGDPGGGRGSVKYYEGGYDSKLDVHYSPWETTSQQAKDHLQNRNKSIIIGHSWGADTSLAYADNNYVDLLISVDPVGFSMDYGMRAYTHINVTADPGLPFTITWARKRICKCCCWRCCKRIYIWYPRIKHNWDTSDWIAYFGGKYSNYFHYRYVLGNDNIIYRGHHGEFVNMIDAVKKRYSNNPIKLR